MRLLPAVALAAVLPSCGPAREEGLPGDPAAREARLIAIARKEAERLGHGKDWMENDILKETGFRPVVKEAPSGWRVDVPVGNPWAVGHVVVDIDPEGHVAASRVIPGR